eukprot:s4601_g4.t1
MSAMALSLLVQFTSVIAGLSFFLGTQLHVLKGERQRIRMHATLKELLKILKRAKVSMAGGHGEEENDEESSDVKSETQSEIETRHKNSEMCEVSGPELWMYFSHGDAPSPESSR